VFEEARPAISEVGEMTEAAGAGWCEHCNRLVGAEEVREVEGERHCPTCDQALAGDEEDRGDEDAPPHAPWHFKVMVFATIGYLIYRFIWFIGWLSHH
jgi:hypothetical protein